MPSLLVNGQYSTIFNVTTSAVVPLGTYANFNFEITDGAYSYNTNFIELIGDLAEDYETGDSFKLADYNGELNGGDYNIIFIDMSASW